MRLEDKCVAAYRDRLIKSDAKDLLRAWEKIDTDIKGGNEDGTFDDTMRRDVVAYTLLRYIDMRGGYAFGGFVRAHASGKHWKDLDIAVPDRSSAEFRNIALNMVEFVAFVLSLSKKSIQLKPVAVVVDSYAFASYELCIQTTTFKVVVPIDISCVVEPTKYSFLPVTVGSCLKLERGAVAIRNISVPSDTLKKWRIDEVMDMLQNGEDVKLCSPRSHVKRWKDYASYYWSRIDHIVTQRWILYPADCDEPNASFA